MNTYRRYGPDSLISEASDICESRPPLNPHQYGAGDVIALNARFAALAALDPGQLFGLAMKLLDLGARGAVEQKTGLSMSARRVRRVCG